MALTIFTTSLRRGSENNSREFDAADAKGSTLNIHKHLASTSLDDSGIIGSGGIAAAGFMDHSFGQFANRRCTLTCCAPDGSPLQGN